jgi:lipoprotein-anchoring transpeptidase ErfK/SrfK
MNRVLIAAALAGLAALPGQVLAGPIFSQSPGVLRADATDIVQLQATRPVAPTSPVVARLFPRPVPAATARPTGRSVDPAFLPRTVAYSTSEAAGTIIIDTDARYLYLILGDGQAKRYGVGVGRPGFEWAGIHRISRKAEWPDWTPPPQMRARQPGLPVHMDGGPDNPLGARAMYLGSTLYRIHGSNQPWTIGHAVSSGCIRMRNEDVIDLYDRVGVGTKVVVL